MKEKAFRVGPYSWRTKLSQIARHLRKVGETLQQWEQVTHGEKGNRTGYTKIQGQLSQARKDLEALGYLVDDNKDFLFRDEGTVNQGASSPILKPLTKAVEVPKDQGLTKTADLPKSSKASRKSIVVPGRNGFVEPRDRPELSRQSVTIKTKKAQERGPMTPKQ